MPSLTDKLKALGVKVGTSEIDPGQKSSSSKRDLIDALPGSWESTPAGDCFVVRKKLPQADSPNLEHLTADWTLSIFDSLEIYAGLSKIPLSEYLFIDTETTGLSGGAGSYVFLIGVAKFVEDHLHFAQFFLQDPGYESAQLSALETFTSSTSVIVSYNGKSFDLPRIKTRYRFHGWPIPFENKYHLDLLHIARRLWKDHLPNCTLGELEHSLLGLERDGLDIPGWQVSEFFFRYLQEQDPEPLRSIFYHNEVDVLSLVSLLDYISVRLSSPLDVSHPELNDLISVGKYLAYLKQRSQAIDVISSSLASPDLDLAVRVDGLLTLADLHKKDDKFPQAIPCWLEAAEFDSIPAKIELAMYYEHRASDLPEAIHWTLSALESLQNREVSNREVLQQALQHRLQRLKMRSET